MTAARAGMKGAPPSAVVQPIEEVAEHVLTGDEVRKLMGLTEEQLKYWKCWNDDRYRNFSPGENCVPLFLQTIGENPPKGLGDSDWTIRPTLNDWGCGSGRASKLLAEAGFRVRAVDFASNCLDQEVRQALNGETLKFVEHDLTKPIALRSDYGFCCDVMEHVPEEDVSQVLRTILENSLHVLFQISTVEDHFSKVIDDVDHLHLTVRPYSWWLQKFADFGCIVHHSNEFPNHCIFYVTGHKTFIFNKGEVNIAADQAKKNIAANAKSGIPQLLPHDEQEGVELVMACGGPSLDDDAWDEITGMRQAGHYLVTVNGTYNEAISRGIRPSLQFLIDGRGFNKRFVEPAPPFTDETKYVVATQCDPELVKTLPKDRSFLWQVTVEDEFLPVIEEHYGKIYEDWFPVPGGSTVTLRALCALQMMGFRKIHMYGFDSCIMDDRHHGYEQKENDGAPEVDVRVGRGTKYDRTFRCQAWMATQAKEFQLLTKVYFQNLQLNVVGDGLIAHLIRSGADLSTKKEE